MSRLSSIKRLAAAFAVCAAILVAPLTSTAFAIEAEAVNNVESIALKGFDPVAYFVDGKPKKGDPEITSSFTNVTYEFTTKEHKALFDANPAKYVPEYNGFCAFGVTEGLKIDVDPHAYAINEGKLNVFFSDDARDEFQKTQADSIALAHKNWAEVKKLTKVIR